MSSYDNIERPYGELLEREPDNLIPAVENGSVFGASGTQEDQAGTTTPTSGGGNVSDTIIKNSEQFSDLWIQNTLRSINWKPRKQGFYIDGATGYAEFANIFLAGGIEATTGSIGGWTIAANELNSGNVKIQSLAERILMGAATAPGVGVGIFMGKDGADYKFRAGDPAAAYMQWDGSILALQGGVVTSLGQGSDLALMGWQANMIFSSTDQDTVAWGAGTLRFHNGINYSISAGNTGNMSSLTYIYLDSAISTTVLQITTTAATAVGPNKLLIAVARNNAEAGKAATFQVFGGSGGVSPFITADNIAANSITANEIVANSITAAELATTLLYAGAITLDTNGHLKGGQTAYDTGTGFFLGYSGGLYKFSLGNSIGNKLLWDGSALSLTGEINATSGMIGGTTISPTALTGGVIQTANTGNRVAMEASSKALVFKNDTKNVASVSAVYSTNNPEGLIIGSRFEPTDLGAATVLGWWAHDQPSLPEPSLDSSGNNLDLTEVGTPTRRNPKTSLSTNDSYGRALELNGSTQYVSRVDEALLSITGSHSFVTWVYIDVLPTSGNSQTLMSKNETTTNNRSYLFQLHNNAGSQELRLTLSNNGTATETESVAWAISAGTWYFVGYSYDASTGNVKFFVNGTQQGATQVSSITSIFDSTASFALGATNVNSAAASFLDGALDETVLFTGVLPDTAFTSLYNSGDGKTFSHALGLYLTGISMRTRRGDSTNNLYNDFEIFSTWPAGGYNPDDAGFDGISTAGGRLNFNNEIDPQNGDNGSMHIQFVRAYFASTLLPDNDTSRNLGSAALSWNNIYSNNTLNVSDERKKKNIRGFSGGLNKIKQLQTKTFKRKGRKPEDDKDEVGLMAQEVLQVFPEAVEVLDITNKRGEVVDQTYAINQTVLLNAALNAIKELNAKVEALEASINNGPLV